MQTVSYSVVRKHFSKLIPCQLGSCERHWPSAQMHRNKQPWLTTKFGPQPFPSQVPIMREGMRDRRSPNHKQRQQIMPHQIAATSNTRPQPLDCTTGGTDVVLAEQGQSQDSACCILGPTPDDTRSRFPDHATSKPLSQKLGFLFKFSLSVMSGPARQLCSVLKG